jgi:hypothetical protein
MLYLKQAKRREGAMRFFKVLLLIFIGFILGAIALFSLLYYIAYKW